MKRIQLFTLIILMIGTSALFMSNTQTTTLDDSAVRSNPVRDKYGDKLQAQYVRKNAHKDNENMQILADALKKMKEKDCTNPLSWYMQGAIHGAPTITGDDDKDYEIVNQFCDYEKAVTEIWHNCTHVYEPLGLTDKGARIHFYTWHKMYLNHFEKIIRHVSGKPEFTLPYWEYDNSDYQTLPDLFRDEKSSLYTSLRSSHMNEGKSISEFHFFDYEVQKKDNIYEVVPGKHSMQNTDFTDPHKAFEAHDFWTFTDFRSGGLEGVPHNWMHLYLGLDPESAQDPIGGNTSGGWGYMYQMYSSMDPIFWVHHANIDRLYEKWLISSMGTAITLDGRPSLAEFKQNKWYYRFYDVDVLTKKYGDPNKAQPKDFTFYNETIGLEGIFKMAYGVQDYAYDMFIEDGSYNNQYEVAVQKAIATGKWNSQNVTMHDHIAASSTTDRMIQADGNFSLHLAPRPLVLLSNIKRKKIDKQNWMLEIDIEFSEVPKGSFAVYVKDKKNDITHSKETLAGVMTFFGVGHSHGHGGSAMSDSGNAMDSGHRMGGGHRTDSQMQAGHAHKKHEMTFRFDIDDEIDFNNFSGMLDVRIDGLQGDNIVIDEIKLIQQVAIKN